MNFVIIFSQFESLFDIQMQHAAKKTTGFY